MDGFLGLPGDLGGILIYDVKICDGGQKDGGKSLQCLSMVKVVDFECPLTLFLLKKEKKDLVYHWECKADGCNSSYIGETSRALGKRVKETLKINYLDHT